MSVPPRPCTRAPAARGTAILLALGVVSALPAQDEKAKAAADATSAPPQVRPDVQQLGELLAKAHGIEPGAEPIHSFRAVLGITPRKGMQKDSITVEAQVDFQAPRAMRCTVREKGVRAERGFDPKRGAWAISGDQVLKVQGSEMGKDIEKAEQELRLCRQMLRFLDPQRLLASLQDPSAIRTSDLEIKRVAYRDCTVVEGTLPSFPTFSAGDGPARVTLFVHGETKRLLSLLIVPLGEDGRPRELGELVVLGDHAQTQGMWLPTELKIYRATGPGYEPLVEVAFRGMELRREFAKNHFDRP